MYASMHCPPSYEKPSCSEACVHAVALMENQVANLRKRSIPCDFLSSARTAQDRVSILQDMKSATPSVKLLFITPELLSTEGFLGILKAMHASKNLSLLAVDEAHCISSWGHDFRPAYRKLGMVRQQLPGVPIMALTATATTQVPSCVQAYLTKQCIAGVSAFTATESTQALPEQCASGTPQSLLQLGVFMTLGGFAAFWTPRHTCHAFQKFGPVCRFRRIF